MSNHVTLFLFKPVEMDSFSIGHEDIYDDDDSIVVVELQLDCPLKEKPNG